MKRRYLYVLLFAAPAVLISIIISLLLFGASAGFLWIFAFGDSPWPPLAEQLLAAGFFVVFLTVLVAFLSVAFIAGKNQEEYASLNTKHVIASIGITVLAGLFAVLHQWSVGNVGSKPDGVQCSDFCKERQFTGSGIPPRDAGAPTCSCFDVKGREAVKVPMTDITSGRSK